MNVDENFRFLYAEDVYLLVNSMFYRPKYTILKYLYYNNPTSITMQDPIKMNENIKQYDFMVEEIDKNIKKINDKSFIFILWYVFCCTYSLGKITDNTQIYKSF